MALGLWWVRGQQVQIVAVAIVLSVVVGFICFFSYNRSSYDLTPSALQVSAFNEQGIEYAFVGNYQGQLQFLGRLTQPVPVIKLDQVSEWVRQHPQGYLLSLERVRPEVAVFSQGHREYWWVFRHAADFAELKPL